jgi:hypothetical protein
MLNNDFYRQSPDFILVKEYGLINNSLKLRVRAFTEMYGRNRKGFQKANDTTL